jgi:hypothetical protein
MATIQTQINRIGRELSILTVNRYFEEIPLDVMFGIIERNMSFQGNGDVYPIDEAGERWEGLLCGAEGRATIALKNSKKVFTFGWEKMPSGRWRVPFAYVS